MISTIKGDMVEPVITEQLLLHGRHINQAARVRTTRCTPLGMVGMSSGRSKGDLGWEPQDQPIIACEALQRSSCLEHGVLERCSPRVLVAGCPWGHSGGMEAQCVEVSLGWERSAVEVVDGRYLFRFTVLVLLDLKILNTILPSKPPAVGTWCLDWHFGGS